MGVYCNKCFVEMKGGGGGGGGICTFQNNEILAKLSLGFLTYSIKNLETLRKGGTKIVKIVEHS